MKYSFTVALFALLVSGCALPPYTVPVEYAPRSEMSRESISASIGVTRWRDHRNVTPGAEEFTERAVLIVYQGTQLYINKASYQGERFIPLVNAVRGVYMEQLQALGAKVKPIDILPGSDDVSKLKSLAQDNGVDFVITGNLMMFDSVCMGLWTMECSQKISFLLTMVDKDGKSLMTRELFEASASDNEGSIVQHATRIKQLTQNLLPQAMEKAIARTVEVVKK